MCIRDRLRTASKKLRPRLEAKPVQLMKIPGVIVAGRI